MKPLTQTEIRQLSLKAQVGNLTKEELKRIFYTLDKMNSPRAYRSNPLLDKCLAEMA